MKPTDSLQALIDHLRQVAPEVIDLATAETEEQFCASFDRLLERAVIHLEKNSKNFASLNEVGLSAALGNFFNGMPGVSMMQEGHSNGHVDLTLEIKLASPVQRRLVEAKIEGGPVEHEKGLAQLLGRYVTGRENTSWLLLYVKLKDIKARMQALRDNLDQKRPLNQTGACLSHNGSLKWIFTSDHGHSSGETVRVVHVGCNLFAN
jgi:hypothetical protein